jgi:hypothetical protein
VLQARSSTFLLIMPVMSIQEPCMPLKIIGAGLGRTGTLSLKAALEELGFSKCYHMAEVVANPSHVQFWSAAARGESVDWETLFEAYQATVDWPACSFYRELMDRYPDAKVILTLRNPERWYESARQTIYHVRGAFPRWTAPFVPRMREFQLMLDRLIWDGFFQGRFEDKPYAIERFKQHIEEVRNLTPADRLLVYEIEDGWGPLCFFLGVPIPKDKTFPRLNDAEEFRSRIRRAAWTMRLVACGMVVLGAVGLVMVAYVVLKRLLYLAGYG